MTITDRKDEVECFNCHQKGHMSYNRSNNAMIWEGALMTTRSIRGNQEVSRPGEETKVKGILLDTGCSRMLVHRDRVPIVGKVRQ